MKDCIQEENSLGHIHGFFKDKEVKLWGWTLLRSKLEGCEMRDAVLCIRTEMHMTSQRKWTNQARPSLIHPIRHHLTWSTPTSSDIADENFAKQKPP